MISIPWVKKAGSKLKVSFYLNDQVETKGAKWWPSTNEDTTIRTVFEIINANGMEGLGDAVSILTNEAMKVERI